MSDLIENTPSGPTRGPGSGADEPRGPRREPPVTRIVRYGAMGWVGEFTCKPGLTVPWGAKVVVQTERGIELGEPLGPPPPCAACDRQHLSECIQAYTRSSGPEFCRARAGRILRLASEQDTNEQRHLNAHVREDIDQCAELAARLNLELKMVTAEHLLGGERIVFYFRAPARVDFRQLVRELAHAFHTRIEMRQVGARDEARLVADFEICGRECCCRNFLKKLRPVNMKMAKLQKSTLDPSKVSGRCGRLRCCLRYEHLGYEELVARLPRLGSRVEVAAGVGTVFDRQILTQLVAIRTDDDRVVTVPLEEIKAFNLPPAPPRPEPARDAGAAERPGRDRPRQRGPAPAPEPTGPGESRFRPRIYVANDQPAGTISPSAQPMSPSDASADTGAGGRRRRRRRRRSARPDSPPAASDPGPQPSQ